MILSSFWYHSGILSFLHVKFIADFRMMVMACSGHQFSLCRWFTYRTIILPTPDECSNVLFVLSYMKGGSAGPWATQKINSILYPANMEEVTWAGFVSELDKMFADPNCQATTQRKLATLHQGDSSVEELI